MHILAITATLCTRTNTTMIKKLTLNLVAIISLSILFATHIAVPVGAVDSTAAPSASGSVPADKAKGNCAILPAWICSTSSSTSTDPQQTGIFMILKWVLQLLSVGIGIAAVGTLVYAGILYSSAGGGQEQVTKAKKLITDTVIGIIAYALMFLALNWLIPGGVIG